MHSAQLLRSVGLAFTLGVVGLAASGSGGCHAANGVDDTPNVLERIGEPKAGYKVVPPPNGASVAESDAMGAGSAPTRRIVFLNRNGGSFDPGYDDPEAHRASVISSAVKLPGYEKSDASWGRLTACVQKQLEKYNVDVVDSRPTALDHMEVVVGGMPSHAGMAKGSGGIAPMNADCSVVEKAVVFVFSQALDEDRECAITTQEIGSAFGLDHVMSCGDAMSYADGCSATGFADVDAKCGELSARSCLCGGSTQNSAQKLMKTLGGKAPTAPAVPDGGAPTPPGKSDGGAPPVPGTDGGAPIPPDDGGAPIPPTPGDDKTPPAISALSPADGATLSANTTIDVRATIDDPSGVAQAALRWTIGSKTVDWVCGDFNGEVTCDKSAGVYTWHVPVGSGTRQWSVRAVDGKGNEATTTPRTLNLSGTTPPPPPSACAVTFTSPADGSSLTPGQHFTVSVNVSCTATAVKLIWHSPVGDMPYDLTSSGSGWSIGLDLSTTAAAGKRTLTVDATGADGKTYSATETINVTP